MKESFLKEIECFIENTYQTDAVVFQEVIFEQPKRSLISLCYYWDPLLEADMYELVYSLKTYSNGKIECESIGRFPQESPRMEEIAKALTRLCDFH